jgi:hypothetical protein
MTPPPPAWTPPAAPDPAAQAVTPTLADIEQTVKLEVEETAFPPAADPADDVDDAREEVSKALAGSDTQAGPQEPIQALNAQPLGDDLHADETPDPAAPSLEDQIPGLQSPKDVIDSTPGVKDPNAPPPVPPPFVPSQANSSNDSSQSAK